MTSSAKPDDVSTATPGWTVEYIMDVDLQSKDGTDIPIYNKTLRYMGQTGNKMYLGQQYGRPSERFVAEKEDYWLFHIHSHAAEFEIAIGGERPQF
ncbi:uncharacterized protein N7483_000359 [Penicillium malachiteum]|uniref:uncharacterized protein n=1 Tax=Penicillium malachiteum TaxID=1324776 RepID=UPI0025497630|nr:uncharacterized protein N7483_000359 [Penicillium malachiteum]KAJ5735234.1 hypothetical protein N7483_000359 [Penicillium malachiteum]